MNLNLSTSRGRFGRFGGYTSLGECQSLPGSQFCRDNNTGSVVACDSAPCHAPTAPPVTSNPGSWSSNDPVANPQYANIPIGGFVGDFQVMTLDSFLSTVLAAKESPFMANVLARGADTAANQAADFQAQADSYCAINGALPDCGQKAQLVAKYRALYLAWAGGQKASTYQSGDSGSLVNPTNTLSNTAPVYTPPPTTSPSNVLNPPSGTTNPVGGNQNITGQQQSQQHQQSQQSTTDDALSWLKDNWLLVAAGIGAVVLLPSLMGKR